MKNALTFPFFSLLHIRCCCHRKVAQWNQNQHKKSRESFQLRLRNNERAVKKQEINELTRRNLEWSAAKCAASQQTLTIIIIGIFHYCLRPNRHHPLFMFTRHKLDSIMFSPTSSRKHSAMVADDGEMHNKSSELLMEHLSTCTRRKHTTKNIYLFHPLEILLTCLLFSADIFSLFFIKSS